MLEEGEFEGCLEGLDGDEWLVFWSFCGSVGSIGGVYLHCNCSWYSVCSLLFLGRLNLHPRSRSNQTTNNRYQTLIRRPSLRRTLVIHRLCIRCGGSGRSVCRGCYFFLIIVVGFQHAACHPERFGHHA